MLERILCPTYPQTWLHTAWLCQTMLQACNSNPSLTRFFQSDVQRPTMPSTEWLSVFQAREKLVLYWPNTRQLLGTVSTLCVRNYSECMHVYIHMHVYIYTCTHMYIHMCLYMHECAMRMSMHMWMSVCMHEQLCYSQIFATPKDLALTPGSAHSLQELKEPYVVPGRNQESLVQDQCPIPVPVPSLCCYLGSCCCRWWLCVTYLIRSKQQSHNRHSVVYLSFLACSRFMASHLPGSYALRTRK